MHSHQNHQSSSQQQSHHRSFTPTGQYPIQPSKSQQSIQQMIQQQQPPHRISNPNISQNNNSFTQNRNAINPDSFSSNRQMIERGQYNIPTPQYMHGARNASTENKENNTPPYQSVQTLPNYQSNKPSNSNYPPPAYQQPNQNAQSSSYSKEFFNNHNTSQQQQYNSQRVPVSPNNQYYQQQNSTPSSSRFTPEQLKNYVTEQLEDFKVELMKNFQNVVQETIQKNQISSNAIENLKRQVGSNKLDINQVQQKMENINIQIDEIRNLPQNQELNLNQEYLEREVQQTIRNLYEDKIENIEASQNEIRLVLDNLKDQLVKEIADQMNSIGNAIQTKAQEEDEIIYQNISDVKHQWEKKLNLVFDQMNTKINNIEQSLENFKKEKAIPKAEFMQNEIYQKFDECVKRYESQLMHVKAQIDSKLDKSQLQEVIHGYKNIKENEIFNKIGLEVENLKRLMEENSQEVEKSAMEFEGRIRKFEQYVEAKLRDYNQKLKDKFENSASIENQVKQQEYMIQQFEEQINQLNEQYENLQQELKSHDSNVFELKQQSEERFEKLVKDLNMFEDNMSKNNSKVQNDLALSHQNMDDKVENLNKEMQILLTQMSAFQNALDENIQQFNQKINLEQQQNNKILNQIQQNPSVSPIKKNLPQNNKSNFQSDNLNQVINGKESQVSTKYDDYLQKYEDFNKEVQEYLSQRNEIQEDDLDKNQNHQDYDEYTKSNLNQQIPNEQESEIKKAQQQKQINSEKNRGRRFKEEDNEEEEEEEEVVYELDDKGYLIDEKGNYILDDEGKPIQLSQEHIEYLKTNHMLQEDEN
ncbi:hypothetical protein TTHERM_00133420 (macronuclear) [Tetrahymena thermophila SB210]|uniref:Uncharacterized protein n=1 Tax=Tetrahymena thermophila (strain SB210) TaxID=312017 RepID=I7M259_TETTS|nr:hypothetical protein TTHERM_00133420 [Tetrahymena thermophila SB210]EAR99376.1 hypothetical protein TTHERM_00133420 [Tetrahymena thermophila SB210]|eukprot:XP_001019621.1 hypothetical protein TTHERM_00133420 [Tetrahymena thermophila SB210]